MLAYNLPLIPNTKVKAAKDYGKNYMKLNSLLAVKFRDCTSV